MGKEFQKVKSFVGRFPPRQHASIPPRPTSVHEPGLPPVSALPTLTAGTHLSGLSPPNPPLLRAHVSSARATSMSTCPPAIVNCHLTLNVPLRHLTLSRLHCYCPSLRQPGSDDDALTQHAMLAKLSWLKARHLGRCIAMSCAHAQPIRRHVMAHARLPRGHAQCLTCPAHHPNTDVQTKPLTASPPRKPLPLPALAALYTRVCTLAQSERNHALHTAPEPSHHPLSVRTHIKGAPHLLHFVHTSGSCPPPVSRHRRTSPQFPPCCRCRAASPASHPRA
jgi:hypothetical protein